MTIIEQDTRILNQVHIKMLIAQQLQKIAIFEKSFKNDKIALKAKYFFMYQFLNVKNKIDLLNIGEGNLFRYF